VFSLDDRTGNVLTTLVVFGVALGVLYEARAVVLLVVLSLLFAYLLEPLVGFAERRLPLVNGHRSRAIAQVYLTALIMVIILGYAFGPQLAAQLKKLNARIPEMVDQLSSTTTNPNPVTYYQESTIPRKARVRNLLIGHREFILGQLKRVTASLASLGEKAIWLLAVPILAIFLLSDRHYIIAELVAVAGRHGNQNRAMSLVEEIDTTLAKYIRAQLALAGLSFLFYTACMFVLGFPYAVALGFLGGALEFLPAVGWIASGTTILTVGFLAHAHWIRMAALFGIWRLVQAYVNSPRIMGKTVQLRPLTVIVALMVGGQVGGIAGIYLAVPALAVGRIVWTYYTSAVRTDQ
jgi:predicted PurR-regulated permease PerM